VFAAEIVVFTRLQNFPDAVGGCAVVQTRGNKLIFREDATRVFTLFFSVWENDSRFSDHDISDEEAHSLLQWLDVVVGR
jgi:hypothetical protein